MPAGKNGSTKFRAMAAMALAGAVVALVFSLPAAPAARAEQHDNMDTLYKRLGGYDAIAAVVDDFIGRLGADAQFTPFLAGHSQDTLKKLRQHVVELVCQATGGPCVYMGRDMKTAHAGLGINKRQWEASVGHLVASLDKFKVPKKEKEELLAIVAPLEKEIVEKP
jgi:hemoglobin